MGEGTSLAEAFARSRASGWGGNPQCNVDRLDIARAVVRPEELFLLLS